MWPPTFDASPLLFTVKKKNAFIALLILSHLQSKAKADSSNHSYANAVSFCANNFMFPKITPFRFSIDRNFADQFGIFYRRNVFNKWSAAVGYYAWNDLLSKKENPDGPKIPGILLQTGVGSHLYRLKYRMLDLSIAYSEAVKKNVFTVGVGASRYWGTNIYIDSIYVNPAPPNDAIFFTKAKQESYIGLVPFLSYEYLLLNNRFGIGADVRLRKYFQLYSSQVDYGIHISARF